MPASRSMDSKGVIRLSKVDLAWIVVGAVVPIVIALLNYSQNPTDGKSGLLVTVALILGSFSLITTRIRALERALDNLQRDNHRHDAATTEIIAATLSSEDMKACRRLFSVFNTILGFSNPLMNALAKSQLNGLAEFLEKFDKGLPFFPENELITIDKHYTSFMRRMGRRGKYVATTFVHFWHEQDEEILRDFFHNNEVAANDGVNIRRIFLISESDKWDPQAVSVLRRHASITGNAYQNGGSIETKVLVVDVFNRDQDDFGIYVLDDNPMAIAIAKFDGKSDRLRGNEVGFDQDYMRKKLQLFEGRWGKGIDIQVYLEDHCTRTKAVGGRLT